MADFVTGLGNFIGPTYRPAAAPVAGGAAPAPGYVNDQLSLAGGAAPGGAAPGGAEYQALVQQTDAMINSPDLRQKYAALANMTKMQPADALTRIQTMINQPGQDPTVVQLAQRAQSAMQQMSGQAPAGATANTGGAYPGQATTGYMPNGTPQYGVPQYGQQGAPQYGPQGVPQYGQVGVPQYGQPGVPQYGQPGVPSYQGTPVMSTNPQDAQLMMQMLQSDLAQGGDPAINAIRQLMGLMQSNPAMKEPVFNLLLNHAYYKLDVSQTEALRALASMNDPRIIPYAAAIARGTDGLPETKALALQILNQNAANNGMGGPGIASNGQYGGQSVEYIRAMEMELHKGGADGMAALQKIRQALGPDARQQGPLRQEVIRVLLTQISTKYDPVTVTASIQMLGEMKAREMDAPRYLEALARSTDHSQDTKNAARAAMLSIMQP